MADRKNINLPLKRALQTPDSAPIKKRKTDGSYSIFSLSLCDKDMEISKIVSLHPVSGKWLVEWKDCTRSWEQYENIRDLAVFRIFIERILFKPKPVAPWYIN